MAGMVMWHYAIAALFVYGNKHSIISRTCGYQNFCIKNIGDKKAKAYRVLSEDARMRLKLNRRIHFWIICNSSKFFQCITNITKILLIRLIRNSYTLLVWKQNQQIASSGYGPGRILSSEIRLLYLLQAANKGIGFTMKVYKELRMFSSQACTLFAMLMMSSL